MKKIAVIGLGYVGLPLLHAFAGKYEAIGFDISQSRIDELNEGFDRTLEISGQQLEEVKDSISFTNDIEKIRRRNLDADGVFQG